MNSKNSRQGGVMLIVLVVLITLSTLSVGLFRLAERDAVEAIYAMSQEQAFWLAESSLQQNYEKIIADKPYRDSIPAGQANALVETGSMAVDDSGVAGVYEAYTWKTGTNDYMIEVHAVVREMKRRLTLKAALGSSLNHAIVIHDGNARIGANSTLNGGLYAIDGGLEIGANSTINGDVKSWGGDLLLEAGVTITGGTYAQTVVGAGAGPYIPEDKEIPFVFNENMYDAEVAVATAIGVPPPASIDLTAVPGTLYVNGGTSYSHIINNSGQRRYLVVRGNMTSSTVDTQLDDHVFVITSGGFQSDDGGVLTLGDDTHIYALGNVDIGSVAMNPGASKGSALVALGGNCHMKGGVNDFVGVVAGKGNIHIDQQVDLTGSLISIDGNLHADLAPVNITYKSSVVPDWLRNDFVSGASQGTVSKVWNETTAQN